MDIKRAKSKTLNRFHRERTRIFVKILTTFLLLTVLTVLFSSLLISASYEEVINRTLRGGLNDLAAPNQSLYLTAHNVQIQIALMVLLTIVLTSFFAIVISGSLTRPIKKLVQGTKEIASGNLDFKLRLSAPREIMALADSFNLMSRDLKSSLSNLKIERDKTKAIIQYLTDGLVVVDSRQKISMINPRAKEMLDFKHDDWRIKVSRNLLADKKPHYRDLAKVIYGSSRGGSKSILPKATKNYIVSLKNNGELILKITSTPLYDDKGQVAGSMRVLHDVSREQMIDRMKSEFITIAAHQLRTPLSAVKWALKLLQEENSDFSDEQADLIDKAYLSNDRMIRLVNDLLDVSLIEEGKYAFVFFNTNFGEVIKTIDDIFKEPIKQRQITFIKKIPKKLPVIMMDKDKIILALENLMDNAVKYTPINGRIVLSVEVLANMFKVSVKDNGVGIPKSHLHRLFSKFFRAENVMRMQTDGSGLGLFIVKKIIEEHKGTVKAISKEGVGTTIEFVLPLKKV